MNIHVLHIIVFMQLVTDIAINAWLWFNNSGVSPVPPIQALDSAIIAYLVESFVPTNVFPDFLSVHMLKKPYIVTVYVWSLNCL